MMMLGIGLCRPGHTPGAHNTIDVPTVLHSASTKMEFKFMCSKVFLNFWYLGALSRQFRGHCSQLERKLHSTFSLTVNYLIELS
jgi:hypothetical protein